MRRDGFMSNRLFDAGACGARILSDAVAGADEIFGPLLRTFRADADVPALLADPDAPSAPATSGWPARRSSPRSTRSTGAPRPSSRMWPPGSPADPALVDTPPRRPGAC